MPNHLLQWEAIRWARTEGCTSYDFWGAPDNMDESDPMWGVYRFKAGFGGRFVRHIGAYDFPVSRLLYWFYSVAMPRYLDRLRARHRRARSGDAREA
jgi:lipid II:glycine glycyltransferase (peptidoglycan interpeptide bridge formation enzyme)